MGNQQAKERRYYGKYIDWERAEPPSPPGKPYLSPDGADLPDVIKIRWAKPMHDGGAPILGYVVEHRRTGSPHWLRASPHLTEDPELILTGLEPGWRYQFRVSAENAIGRSEPGQLSEPLTVTLHRSAASAPHFNRELQDIIALENETVEFVVQVIATPPAKISWYKDGFELFSSRRTKIVTEDEKSALIIYQAALEDEGEIKCTATNRAGHVVTKATLKLEAPPRIRLPRQYEEGLLFEKGETMRLKVSTAGRPLPTVAWYHNGEKMQSGGRFLISELDRGSSLKITDACRQDRGEYMVQGTNKIGADTVSFLVTITDRPSPPGRPGLEMTLGKMVTLGWSSPDDDGGCKIGAYIVEYFRVGWDVWLKAATSRQLTVTLSDLIEGSEYKFRVKAENPYGVSEASEESDSVFIPDPKRGILKPEGRVTPMINDSKWSDQPKLRGILKTSDAEETKKRQASPIQDFGETEAAKKRRLLEENARKLLDTPLTVLLAESQASPRTIDKPPRKFKDQYRSHSVSPAPDTISESSPPPVPKRRNKMRQQDDLPPITITEPPSPSPPPKAMSPPLLRDDSILHGSSELMLVLVPDDAKAKSGELSSRQKSEIELSLSEPGIAPPLSLSAPELGSEELEFPPMRDAVSSTELLYVRAMARIYQDSEDDAFQTKRRSIERRSSLRDGTALERKSSLRESYLERRHSFKETVPEEKLSPTSPRKLTKERSPPRSMRPPGSPLVVRESKIPIATVKPEPALATKTTLKSILRKDERLSSVEREHLEFAKVRERLKLKDEQVLKQPELPPRPLNFKHQSNMSSQLSSYDGETGSEPYNEEDMSIEEEEELEEEENLEEEEEEVEEDYLDEEEAVDDENEEDILNLKAKILQDEPHVSQREKPPAVPPHSDFRKEVAEKGFKKEAPLVAEEETYHPRSMIPTRSVLRAIPATVVEELPKEMPEIKVEEVQEEQPEVEKSAKEEKAAVEPESYIPKPIQKTPEKKNSRIFNKIGFSLKKNKKKRAVATLAEDAVPPVASVALPKPILKKGSLLKKKEKNKDKAKIVEEESPSKETTEEPKKKQVRIAEPGQGGLSVPVVDDPKLSPMTKARNQRIQRRQQSLEEEEQANKVLIYHYSDIVREFGTPRKPPPKLYLEFDELDAHAGDKNEIDEVSRSASDLEERGSVPDFSELDAEQGSTTDLPVIEPSNEEPPESTDQTLPETVETDIREVSPKRSHSSSPVPPRILTTDEKIRSSVDYLTDVAIFIFACWLYLFKNELYVIPVLILLVYRQIQDIVHEKYVMVRDTVVEKIPKRFRKEEQQSPDDENN